MLTITEALRKKGVVGKFVEFFGPGLAHLTIADRVTLGNMCPEYGATVAIFPIDDMTLDYLRLTGRDAQQIALVEAYAKAQGLFRTDDSPDAVYSETLELDLATVEPSLAGPRRPQDRVPLSKAKPSFAGALARAEEGRRRSAAGGGGDRRRRRDDAARARLGRDRRDHELHEHLESERDDRRRACREEGRRARPDAQAVGEDQPRARIEGRDRLSEEGRLDSLSRSARLQPRRLRLHDLHRQQRSAARRDRRGDRERGLVVASVLSGNRNFEGRIQQDVRANYLASPPLVVAYALAGIDEHRSHDRAARHRPDGKPVYLKDIWPTEQEIQQTMLHGVTREVFRQQYASVFEGDERWQKLPVPTGDRFAVGRRRRPTSASRRSSRTCR